MKKMLALLASSTVFLAGAAVAAGSDQAPGQRFAVSAAKLPEPYADKAARNPPSVIARRSGDRPLAPKGFAVSLFAENLQHPRKLLVLPNGDVLLAEQDAGYVTMLRDGNGDGKAEASRFAGGFDEPYGLAQVPDGPHRGDVLVADARGIWRVPLDGKGADPVAVTAQGVFGGGGGHSTRSLAVDPQTGAMLVGVGSAGNIDEEAAPRATIQVFDRDGGNQQTFASGTRNPIGIHFQPGTGKLWTVVQERDGLGSNLVPDYFTEVERGDFFGWPYAYSGGKPQPDLAERAPDKVKATRLPSLLFQAHSAAMDFAFVPDSWPAAWRGDALVALKGSWNRREPTGYKVVHVPFKDGRPEGGYENFLTGFWTEGTKNAGVWGRPASLAFLPDGGLLVADDSGGTVWKVLPVDPGKTGATAGTK